MSRFFAYDPNQAYLLPPTVKDVLQEDHLCFWVHRAVEQFDLSQFEEAYGAEGRLAYPPAMMLKVWLYAFCLRVTSTRRLERRIQEDLAFRYLAGGLAPDHGFRRVGKKVAQRHPRRGLARVDYAVSRRRPRETRTRSIILREPSTAPLNSLSLIRVDCSVAILVNLSSRVSVADFVFTPEVAICPPSFLQK